MNDDGTVGQSDNGNEEASRKGAEAHGWPDFDVEPACTVERFMRDVEKHGMNILADDGVRRHLRFSNNGSSIYRFDIITWPGALCFIGDMGCYVFERLDDMFEFFRAPPGAGLRINPCYWSEKVQAECVTDGVKEYSSSKFQWVVREYVDERDELEDDDLREAIEEEVLAYADEGEAGAREAADSFNYRGRDYFTDFWERDLTQFTHRFLWCCYALVWAIGIYDASKKLPEVGK